MTFARDNSKVCFEILKKTFYNVSCKFLHNYMLSFTTKNNIIMIEKVG